MNCPTHGEQEAFESTFEDELYQDCPGCLDNLITVFNPIETETRDNFSDVDPQWATEEAIQHSLAEKLTLRGYASRIQAAVKARKAI
jgi:hypothetical protein